MSQTVSKLLEIARSQIGYKEKETNSQLDSATGNAGDANYTKYARDLHAAGYYQASKQGFAWCDMFVDWCFLQLCSGDAAAAQKMIFQSGPYGAGCKFSAQYYKVAGRYFKEAQPGDQIFFNGYSHTGIVESVADGIVTTIEGNTSNMVARRTYAVAAKCIDGYGRPKYDSEATEAPATGTAGTGSNAGDKELEVAAADLIASLRKQGYSNHKIYQIGKAIKNSVYDDYIDDMARLVIAGEYGNGEERKQKLAAEGHPFAVIQTRANKILKG